MRIKKLNNEVRARLSSSFNQELSPTFSCVLSTSYGDQRVSINKLMLVKLRGNFIAPDNYFVVKQRIRENMVRTISIVSIEIWSTLLSTSTVMMLL